MLEKDEKISDLLSSVEILLMDRTEVMLMQNWQHVMTAVTSLNQMPKDVPKDVNLMHVRSYLLHDKAKFFRQTIILSAFASAEMQSLFNGPLCRNHAGRIRLRNRYRTLLKPRRDFQLSHRFERFPCDAVTSMAEDRIHYFKSCILATIKKSDSGLLLFVRHYFDYVRVLDLLSKEGLHHGGISEYTSDNRSKNLRRQFRDGRLHVLITTERAHFYNRRRYQGVRHVMFYSVPEHGHYYVEFLEMMNGSCGEATAMWCTFDGLQMERIVGTEEAVRLLNSRSDVIADSY